MSESGVQCLFLFGIARFCAENPMGKSAHGQEVGKQVDIGNNQVEDNREVHDRKEERSYSKE